jgi:thiosulfate reductase cytochrome b subunit
VAAVTIAGCVLVAAYAVARTEKATLERIEAQAPQVKRWAGWVLVGVGVWFLVLAVFADVFADVFPV